MPAQKPVNVAMYAAGGAVAGAVVGAGAMCLSLSLVCFFLLNCSTWFCENLCVLCTRRSEDLEFKLEYIAAIESIQDIYIYIHAKRLGVGMGLEFGIYCASVLDLEICSGLCLYISLNTA